MRDSLHRDNTELRHRILLACIRYLAECPCPRCFVKKSDMRLMGTVRDMKRRQTQRREDTEPVQYDINKTRSWIFEDGIAPNSTLINKVLASRSLVPLQVSSLAVTYCKD